MADPTAGRARARARRAEQRARYARHLPAPARRPGRASDGWPTRGSSWSAPAAWARPRCSTSRPPASGTHRRRRRRRRRRLQPAAPGRSTASPTWAGSRPSRPPRRSPRINPLVDGRPPRPAARPPTTRSRSCADYDVVLDGTDNFPTRYLVNDACVLLGMPHVWGSIYRFDGQVSVWFAGHGPCYRCVFPDPPPPDAVPSCATGGVLGRALRGDRVGPGRRGGQAHRRRRGEPLVGRLLVHDALRQTWDSLTVRADPDCPVCGESPTITDAGRLRGVLRMPAARPSSSRPPGRLRRGRRRPSWPACSPRATAATDGFELVDVREPGERAIVSIPGARGGAPRRVPRPAPRPRELPSDLPVVVHCNSGARSAEAARPARRGRARRRHATSTGVCSRGCATSTRACRSTEETRVVTRCDGIR